MSPTVMFVRFGLAAKRKVISQSSSPRLEPEAPRNRHSPAAQPLNAALLTVPVRLKKGTDLFSCYVELNPARAALVGHPEDYRWSSFAAKIGRWKVDWVDADPCRQSLGPDASQRRHEFRGRGSPRKAPRGREK